MAAVTYVSHTGASTTVELAPGSTVKDGAIQNGIDGIVGECGGNAMCATCHVYVEAPWLERLAPMDDVEDALLDDTVSPRESCSRLGCQIHIGEELDGLLVRMPEAQE
ncbi:MAG: (2Fe-2S)-binding protein [Actinomycetota bacterium]|nr:(2Fe-2S)-binding protein [Actinomycetota bacterium]